MLVDGKWISKWQPVETVDDQGGFVRPPSVFRNWVTPDGDSDPVPFLELFRGGVFRIL
jgi:glutathionyl-hydroquinone reductase